MFTYGWENSTRLWFPCIDSYSGVCFLFSFQMLFHLFLHLCKFGSGLYMEIRIYCWCCHDSCILWRLGRSCLHTRLEKKNISLCFEHAHCCSKYRTSCWVWDSTSFFVFLRKSHSYSLELDLLRSWLIHTCKNWLIFAFPIWSLYYCQLHVMFTKLLNFTRNFLVPATLIRFLKRFLSMLPTGFYSNSVQPLKIC